MNKLLMSALGIYMILSLTGCVVDPYGYSVYDYDTPAVSTVGVYYDYDYYYPGYYPSLYYYGNYGYGGNNWRWHDHHGWGGGHGGGHGGHGGHGGRGHH